MDKSAYNTTAADNTRNPLAGVGDGGGGSNGGGGVSPQQIQVQPAVAMAAYPAGGVAAQSAYGYAPMAAAGSTTTGGGGMVFQPNGAYGAQPAAAMAYGYQPYGAPPGMMPPMMAASGNMQYGSAPALAPNGGGGGAGVPPMNGAPPPNGTGKEGGPQQQQQPPNTSDASAPPPPPSYAQAMATPGTAQQPGMTMMPGAAPMPMMMGGGQPMMALPAGAGGQMGYGMQPQPWGQPPMMMGAAGQPMGGMMPMQPMMAGGGMMPGASGYAPGGMQPQMMGGMMAPQQQQNGAGGGIGVGMNGAPVIAYGAAAAAGAGAGFPGETAQQKLNRELQALNAAGFPSHMPSTYKEAADRAARPHWHELLNVPYPGQEAFTSRERRLQFLFRHEKGVARYLAEFAHATVRAGQPGAVGINGAWSHVWGLPPLKITTKCADLKSLVGTDKLEFDFSKYYDHLEFYGDWHWLKDKHMEPYRNEAGAAAHAATYPQVLTDIAANPGPPGPAFNFKYQMVSPDRVSLKFNEFCKHIENDLKLKYEGKQSGLAFLFGRNYGVEKYVWHLPPQSASGESRVCDGCGCVWCKENRTCTIVCCSPCILAAIVGLFFPASMCVLPCVGAGAGCPEETCCVCCGCLGRVTDQWCKDCFRQLPRILGTAPSLPDAVFDDLLRTYQMAGGGAAGLAAMHNRHKQLPAAPSFTEILQPVLRTQQINMNAPPPQQPVMQR